MPPSHDSNSRRIAGSGPGAQVVPATSTVNFDTSQYAIAKGTIIGLSNGGQICAKVGTLNSVGGASHAILDVVGFLLP
jgi:hypothetical protein